MGRQYTLRAMATNRTRWARSLVMALAIALVVVTPIRPGAHEIPNDVTIHAFVRPEGEILRLLVRAPIAAMRDVQFPIRGQHSLDFSKAGSAVRDAAMLWLADSIAVYEEGTKLGAPRLAATQVSLPSDRSFVSYEAALAHITGAPLPPETDLVWNQGVIDALFEYPIRSDRSRFSIAPALARLGLRVVTVLRFSSPGRAERAFELTGDPGLIRLDPRWHQAALRFVYAGFFHILNGTDHLLFLLCLIVPFRRLAPLIVVITGFTLAHSVTLVASALALAPAALWFPPLIETLIAASIVYMALENIVGHEHLRKSRWAIAAAFGLVHGFGFSFALRETLQFAGSHVWTSLVAFNVGVELGQLLVLLLLVPALGLLFRYVVAERVGTITLSAIVGHTAWHWMTERWSALSKHDWPPLEIADLAAGLRWLMLGVLVAALLWLAMVVRRIYRPAPQGHRTAE
jgi:hydrogenase/urease accessory protein HupE